MTTWTPERLRSAREAAGITPDEAAAAIGVHRTTIYDAERGKHVLRADRAAGLAALYGVPLDEFFTHCTEADRPSRRRGDNQRGRQVGAVNAPADPTGA